MAKSMPYQPRISEYVHLKTNQIVWQWYPLDLYLPIDEFRPSEMVLLPRASQGRSCHSCAQEGPPNEEPFRPLP